VFAKVTLLAVLLLVVGCAGGAEPQQSVEPIGDPASLIDPGFVGAGPAEVDEPEAPLRIQVVELYFPAAEDDGLVAEAREIFATAAPGDRAKQIVADLISGPSTELALRALPRGTRLRQIYVLQTGVAYIDFSDDLRDGLGGGTAEEMLAVYAIVDSVVLNIPEIQRVGILIDGEPIDTLNGHMDLSRPLPPNIELIVGRIASTERPADPDAIASHGRDRQRAAGSTSGS